MDNSNRLSTIVFFILSVGFLQGCVQTTQGERDKLLSVNTPLATPEAHACINAAANKYYLPPKVIKAIDSTRARDGSIVMQLKVDLRDAKCTIDRNGSVRSVVDTSPKSADQIEAEKAAAEGRIL